MCFCRPVGCFRPDATGNLYAANANGNTISKFNSAGVFQAAIGSGNLSNPTFIAFAPTVNVAGTPEPGTFALLAGMVVTGGIFARRRRK